MTQPATISADYTLRPSELATRLCQVNRIHSEISVNCRWLLYAISMA